jgi:hypothetical protein
MRINQIMEADGGLAKQSAVVARLENAGGDIINTARNGNGDIAKIGINGQGKSLVYIVIYPDGTYDRFEGDAIVIYRSSYVGPAYNDPKEAARRILQAQAEKEERQEQAERDRQYRKEQMLRSKRDKLISKYRDVVIPPQYKAICDAASYAFDVIINHIGPDLRSGLGMYDDDEYEEEATRYYDPAVILDLVADRMHDYSKGDNSYDLNPEDCSPAQWEAFNKLPIKYQLKVATPYAGAFDY